MRSYVIYHMLVSLDGRITGDWMKDVHTAAYYEKHRAFQADAYMCGRVTMQGSFCGYDAPDLSPYQDADMPKEDYIADASHGKYAVAVDTHGRLNWQSGVIYDDDPGYDDAHIIEVLCETVSAEYLCFLKERKISYIFCGREELNAEMMLEKLYEYFGIKVLLHEGGGLLGGSFLDAGLIDELSLVLAPDTAGSGERELFAGSKMSTSFALKKCEVLPEGALWLNYRKKGS